MLEADTSNSSQALDTTRYALEAIRLLNEGEPHSALHFLNLCLDRNHRESASRKDQNGNGSPVKEATAADGISPADEVSLLEKRCLIHMKLHHFDEVVNDARRILDKRTDYSLAYKCLLVALCKTSRLEQVTEILKLWRTCSPQDLDMMECRTKLEALINAVKNGIEASDAFSNIEDQLGLSYDWLLARKLQDPQWRYRPLPPGKTSLTLCLPFRFGHCSLGAKCPDAHGADELEEWKNRNTLKTVSLLLDTIKLDSGERYIRRILDRLEEATNQCTIVSDVIPDYMKIRCSKPLEAVVSTTENTKVYQWTFAVETKKPLTNLCLLEDLHRDYFFISMAVIYGATKKINLINESAKDVETQIVEVSSPTALALSGKKNYFTYKVDVKFKSNIYGTFRQTVIFDVGDEPKVIKKLAVNVVPPPDDATEINGDVETICSSPTFDEYSSFQIGGTWNFGNADIVDGFTGDKVAETKLGFALINGVKPEGLPSTLSEPLNKGQYKEIMRYFLTQEERSRQEILAKYNLTAPLNLTESYLMTSGHNDGMTRYSVDKSLYGRMTLFRDVSEDTAVGRLILRSCNYLLMTRSDEVKKSSESGLKPKVYLCPISDKTKNNIYIDVGTTCVRELNLKNADVVMFDIQFQLDRTAFMEMKSVIDQLKDFHLDMLFPNFGMHHHIPWSPIKQWGDEIIDAKVKLNPRQKESLIAITSEAPRIPPILVIGPFGTGKTFTLAQCIHKLLLQPNIRIMVCTHSNSAADLYIKEYLDPWVQEGFTAAKPLRIYYHLRNLNSVHPDVIQYCIIENLRFRPPKLEEILAHKVIVVTLSTSYILMQMNLPKDTFSHILLDEAAQAMESEAITPLMCAGEDTTLVLAGDHMQLSPELFSEEAKSLHPSLLERLHNYYPDGHPCKLMLCENYRSHSSIIDYVSDEFYNKRLQCSMVQPVHDKFYPLTFFSARGEEVQEKDSTSYYNMAEVFEVVDKVSKLVSSWPESWGSYRHESAIGVLTPYSDQVSRIRHALRKKGLYSVSVERVLNVQGKQFRAVFLSTVRSFRPWVKILPEAIGNEVDLGFFSNPKLFNTALTRAQSLVAVVGDPVSLCSEGKCRNLWKDFINVCQKNKSLYGISYTQLEQSILGLEMRVTWGLNPLADVFEPKALPVDYLTNSAGVRSNFKGFQPTPSVTSHHSPMIATPISSNNPVQQFNTAIIPGGAFTSPNSAKHLTTVASQHHHRPISPGNTGFNPSGPNNLSSMTWTPQSHGPIPGIIPQSTMVPPGLGQPSLHHAPYMGYPPLFPPVPPHVIFPPQMGGYPGGRPPPPVLPPNAHLPRGLVLPHQPPAPPAHLRMPIPRNFSRFPNADVLHPPHLSSPHHLPQNLIPPNRPNFPPPISTPQHFDATPSLTGLMNIKTPNEDQRNQSRFPSSSNNSTSSQHHIQPYRQQPPQPQSSLTQEQYMAGMSLFRNKSPQQQVIAEAQQQQQQQMGLHPRVSASTVSAPQQSTSLSSSLNFNDGGIAHLPLADLLHLQQMLERFSMTNGPTEEIRNLIIKVQEAIRVARCGAPRQETQEHREMHNNIVPANKNIWNAADVSVTVHLNSSRIASIAQQLSEVQIAEAAENIWANLGFSDGLSSSVTPLDQSLHQQTQPQQNRRLNNASPLTLEPLLLPSSSSMYARTGSENQSRTFDCGISNNTWNTNSAMAPSFGSLLSTQLSSSNDNYNHSSCRQEEDFAEFATGGASGRSYANVARCAVVTPNHHSGVNSGPCPPHLYNNDQGGGTGVPPYQFFNVQPQNNDGHVVAHQQQQQQTMISQNSVQQLQRHARQQQ